MGVGKIESYDLNERWVRDMGLHVDHTDRYIVMRYLESLLRSTSIFTQSIASGILRIERSDMHRSITTFSDFSSRKPHLPEMQKCLRLARMQLAEIICE